MKIAAAVILYHPTEEVITNIKTYYDFVDKVLIYDNTEIKTPIQDRLLELDKVTLYHDFENKGISIRLNAAASVALELQYDWLLTMDQDSSFSSKDISTYLSCFEKYKNKESVAAFGVKYRMEKPVKDICESEDAEALITSGMLLNTRICEEIGKFDEALFIDSVDHEYCIRAQMTGYRIIQFVNVQLTHAIGNVVNRSSIKSLFIIKKKKEIHSPLRCYYMYRNMLYLEDKYRHSNRIFSKLIRKYVVSHIKLCLLYGRNSLKILRYVQLARQDFRNNKMGKISSEL